MQRLHLPVRVARYHRYVPPAGHPLYPWLSSLEFGYEWFDKTAVIDHRQNPVDGLLLVRTDVGEIGVRSEAADFTVRAGGVYSISARVGFLEEVGPKGWQGMFITMRCSSYDEHPKTPLPVYHCSAVPLIILDAFDETLHLLSHRPLGWEWGLVRVVGTLCEYFQNIFPSRGDKDLATLVSQAEALMRANVSMSLGVRGIADALQVSPSQLFKAFRIMRGVGPATVYRLLRVSAAARLLRRGATVSAAAERYGFTNPYHFSRVFKRVTGVSPSQWCMRCHIEPDEGSNGRGSQHDDFPYTC